ncbi:ubiquitin-like domain-containing protein [Streptomyces sp. NPDC059166]|uniref:ubiquitin-like domain-containing protein n=1 Tax=Streptomyces sp. NPDC059166 TaxID=3346752 RepID=UPI0036C879ED
MGHSQGSHRAPRGEGRTGQAAARAVPVPPPRSLHEEQTLVAGILPARIQVHDPTVLDTPLAPQPRPALRTPAGRQGRHAGHRAVRRHRSAPTPLRSLVPRALVLVVLAGGTAAFLAQDKAVRVDVDGTSRTLHTFADDVGELLDTEGVPVGALDHVVPAPGTGLDDGDEVVVRREAAGAATPPGGGFPALRRP